METEPINKIKSNKTTAQTKNCKSAAKRLSHVITWMKDNGHMKSLLSDLAHSASCGIIKCSPLCSMFRHVRRHAASAKPHCALLRMYSLLLRLHVNSCTNDQCGLQTCPTLRANGSVEGNAHTKKKRTNWPTLGPWSFLKYRESDSGGYNSVFQFCQ